MLAGPPIERLTRRLAETPAEFLRDDVDVLAVLSDLFVDLGGAMLDDATSRAFVTNEAKLTQLRLIAAWLLHDDFFVRARSHAATAAKFLSAGLTTLAAIVPPQQFISDPDRREELARVTLRALELLPSGESVQQATDRLATLDSAERVRVLRETRAAQERIRQVQEAMRQKAAEEAAAAYGRE